MQLYRVSSRLKKDPHPLASSVPYIDHGLPNITVMLLSIFKKRAAFAKMTASASMMTMTAISQELDWATGKLKGTITFYLQFSLKIIFSTFVCMNWWLHRALKGKHSNDRSEFVVCFCLGDMATLICFLLFSEDKPMVEPICEIRCHLTQT